MRETRRGHGPAKVGFHPKIDCLDEFLGDDGTDLGGVGDMCAATRLHIDAFDFQGYNLIHTLTRLLTSPW